ncbi:unnamed protein product, partial [Prorocentrum cordatum]
MAFTTATGEITYKAAVAQVAEHYGPSVVEDYAQRASANGVQILVFPENGPYDTEWPSPDPDKDLCDPDDQGTVSSLACIGKKFNIYLVFQGNDVQPCNYVAPGLCWQTQSPEGVVRPLYYFDATEVIAPNGALVTKYYKHTLFQDTTNGLTQTVPELSEYFNATGVFEAFGVKFGIVICFDLTNRALLTSYANQGITDIVFSNTWYDGDAQQTMANFMAGRRVPESVDASTENLQSAVWPEVADVEDCLGLVVEPFLTMFVVGMGETSPADIFGPAASYTNPKVAELVDSTGFAGKCLRLKSPGVGIWNSTIQTADGAASCSVSAQVTRAAPNGSKVTYLLRAFSGKACKYEGHGCKLECMEVEGLEECNRPCCDLFQEALEELHANGSATPGAGPACGAAMAKVRLQCEFCFLCKAFVGPLAAAAAAPPAGAAAAHSADGGPPRPGRWPTGPAAGAAAALGAAAVLGGTALALGRRGAAPAAASASAP